MKHIIFYLLLGIAAAIGWGLYINQSIDAIATHRAVVAKDSLRVTEIDRLSARLDSCVKVPTSVVTTYTGNGKVNVSNKSNKKGK